MFYYSVLTTGVYCRPSCASRLARRDNVAFHAAHAAREYLIRKLFHRRKQVLAEFVPGAVRK